MDVLLNYITLLYFDLAFYIRKAVLRYYSRKIYKFVPVIMELRKAESAEVTKCRK